MHDSILALHSLLGHITLDRLEKSTTHASLMNRAFGDGGAV